MSHQGAYKNPISKYVHEYMFWKKRVADYGFLANDHYEALFTTLFNVDRSFYTGKRLHDIGCGPCGSLEWADNTTQRVGLDPLAEAYTFLGTDKHRMEYTPDFVEQISFPNEHFDIVTSINSLDHVDNLEKALAEIGRVVAVGGHILIACEVSPTPKPCEPTLVTWNLAERFGAGWDVLEMSRYRFVASVATSILGRQALPEDQMPPDAGVLRLHLQKKAACC